MSAAALQGSERRRRGGPADGPCAHRRVVHATDEDAEESVIYVCRSGTCRNEGLDADPAKIEELSALVNGRKVERIGSLVFCSCGPAVMVRSGSPEPGARVRDEFDPGRDGEPGWPPGRRVDTVPHQEVLATVPWGGGECFLALHHLQVREQRREAQHPAPARAELAAPAPDLDRPLPWVERDCTPVGTAVER